MFLNFFEKFKSIMPERVKSLGKYLVDLIPDRVLFKPLWEKNVPVFIYQMGKVGSKSIYKSLRAQYPGIVLHAHQFSPNDSIWKIRRLYRWSIYEQRPIFVISPIREPIGRNISGFFHNFDRYTNIPSGLSNFSLEKLKEIFLLNYPHDIPLCWFQKNIYKNFGIDVFDAPFSESGFSVYVRNNVNLLVIRSELDDGKKGEIVRDFLGLNSFKIIRENMGVNKGYSKLYQNFIRNVDLPQEYISRMCSSTYFKHFYGQDFHTKLLEKWCGN